MKNSVLINTTGKLNSSPMLQNITTTKSLSEIGKKNNLPQGHKVVRQKLGSDTEKMNFDSKVANNFRTYMANTILSTTANFSDSKGRIEFRTNGTFTEVRSDHLSNEVAEQNMNGYWEVASLRNGVPVILMFSSHPSMLKDSPKGFLPFVVAEHTADFVALPGGAGYFRTINRACT